MTIEHDNSRQQGVEFGALARDLEGEEYPMRNEALLDAYGSRQLELQDGSQSLRDVLEPLGETTFGSAADVVDAVVGMVGDEAIGRKYQSDRGGMAGEAANRSV